MERLQRMLGTAAAFNQVCIMWAVVDHSSWFNERSKAQPGMDTDVVDNAETVHISSLALLKVDQNI